MKKETLKLLKEYKELTKEQLDLLDVPFHGDKKWTLRDEYIGLLKSVDTTLLNISKNKDNPILLNHFELALNGKMEKLESIYKMVQGVNS